MAIRKDYKRLEYELIENKRQRKYLTPNERIRIKQLKQRRIKLQQQLDSLSDNALASRFGVSKSTISRIW